MDITTLTIAEANRKLSSKEISCTELTQAAFDRIDAVEPSVQAFITITKEQALAKAGEIDTKGEFSHPLAGIPLGIKDLICTKGIQTTAGSKILEGFVPPYSATSYERVEQAGGVMVGKANMDEFAMGSSCENSAYHPTHNPWDLSKVPGGSSGGSAAAVAARMCLGSLGTDTGGSIRQPAALCGVVGIKPTYGRVSRSGVMAMAASLDQVGPFALTVEDAAILLSAIAGRDPSDATTGDVPVPDYRANLNPDLKGKKIGIPKEYFEEGLDSEDRKVIQSAIDWVKAQGADVREVSLPHTKYAMPAYYLIMPSEVSANLSRYDGIRFGHSATDARTLDEIYVRSRSTGFGAEPKRRIILGAFALSAGYADKYYHKALEALELIKRDFDTVFDQVDALLTPTSPTTAWAIGEKVNDPVKMYLSDAYTIPANLAGICGLSMPVGFSHGLPVGLQILGKRYGEQSILDIGYALDREIQFHRNVPTALGD